MEDLNFTAKGFFLGVRGSHVIQLLLFLFQASETSLGPSPLLNPIKPRPYPMQNSCPLLLSSALNPATFTPVKKRK